MLCEAIIDNTLSFVRKRRHDMTVSDKKSTRKLLKMGLENLGDREVYKKSASITKALIAHEIFQAAKSIMLYMSKPKEVDTAMLMLAAFEAGKTVTVPKCHWASRTMVPVVIETVNCEVSHGDFGLAEVVSDQVIGIGEIDLLIVPGLGFDKKGQRIGRGAGFYDRFMAEISFCATKCAVCFALQVIEDVPVNDHDMTLDMLVTEADLYRF
jgi:5-formyltetrahydrofolate cyclo-ligase